MVRPVIRVPRVDTANGTSNSSSNNPGGSLRQSLGASQQNKRSGMLSSPRTTANLSERAENRDMNAPMDATSNMIYTIAKNSNGKKVEFNGAAVHDRSLCKVPSLMFDMEDTHEEDNGSGGGYADDTIPSQDISEKLKDLLAPQDEDEYMLGMHVKYALSDALERNGEDMEVDELGERLRTLGYSVRLRTALGGDSFGGSASCLRNLRHRFLAVSLPNSPQTRKVSNREFIVDPKFLDQFEIAHSTMRYDCVLSDVPSAVVVPMGRLTEAVGILCEEMARAFQKTGTPLPPWRQSAAMLSKWQPRRSEDVDMKWGRKSSKQIRYPLNMIQEEKGNISAAGKLAMMDVNAKMKKTSTTPDRVDIEALYSSDDMDESRVRLSERDSDELEDPNNFVPLSLSA